MAAHVCAIEWQKRGLPHAHTLLRLSSSQQISGSLIDLTISAEIPNPAKDPSLQDLVVQHMCHGPCGDLNPSSPCMKDGFCTKGYPKEFRTETESGIDGYPRYRRRSLENGGFTATKKVRGREVVIDNRWIVPYSPFLLSVFRCHLNVELCTSVQSIKYVIKYVNKGEDVAVFAILNGSRDEIKLFQTARYMSCSEAC